jgi:hypothetical protein
MLKITVNKIKMESKEGTHCQEGGGGGSVLRRVLNQQGPEEPG